VVTLITVLAIIFIIGLVAIPVGTFSVDTPAVTEEPDVQEDPEPTP
jgi:hypothetical protein